MDAVRQNDMGRVRGILSSGVGLDSAPQPLPPMTPPLIEAVCAGHRDMVEMFLDGKANLNARDVALGRIIDLCMFLDSPFGILSIDAHLEQTNAYSTGGTALHWAAATGNKELLAILMERAVDVNSPCYSGQTPLHVAAACGHDHIVRLLLSDNAQPDIGANFVIVISFTLSALTSR